VNKILALESILAGAFLFAPSAKAQFTTASTIDCSRYPGAPDLGIQINNCLAAGPATGAVYDITRFTSPQIIFTPIVLDKPGVIISCAVTIFQKAGILVKGSKAAWTGCPDRSTVLVKSADLDQFTVTSSYNMISNLDLEGGKARYRGNGIVLDNTGGQQQQAKISNNLIEAQANDGILNNGGSYNQIEDNNIRGYGAHAVELNGAQFVHITANVITGFGDETSSTIYAHGNCQLTISGNNLIENSAGFPAIDGRACSNLKRTANSFINSPFGIAVEVAGPGEISGNYIAGVTALDVVGGGGTAQANTLRGNGGHAVILHGANQYILSGNAIGLVDTVGGLCGINITGDTIGVHAIGNAVNLTSTGADDYGACLTLTGGHMLNNLIDGLSVDGFSHGDYALFFNNTEGQSTNVSNTIRNVSCVHIAACYKRVDPANNVTVYEDAMMGDTVFDAGTGSNQDIFIQPKLPFAELPSPAGNGSRIYCQDCTPGAVVTGHGAGSMVFRIGGAWKGI
jgi:Right handed beta helix region